MKEIIEFLKYLKVIKNYSELTIINYDKDLKRFISFLNKKDISWIEIDYKIIRNYLMFLHEKQYKNKTIARNISTLRSFYKYLIKEKVITNNPLLLITNPKIESKLPNFLYYNDLEKIFNTQNKDNPKEIRNLLILELLYSTGIRVSELVNIKLKDINNNSIKVLGKGSKERIVYFGKRCEELLNEYLDKNRDLLLKNKTSEYLLINHLGNKITDRGIRTIINDMVKKSSLKLKVSPHTIRHTFATHMLNEGADLKTVQELLGHENISTTGIYTHVSNERLRSVYLNSHPRARK